MCPSDKIAAEAATEIRNYLLISTTPGEFDAVVAIIQSAIARAIVEYDTAKNAITYPFDDARAAHASEEMDDLPETGFYDVSNPAHASEPSREKR